MSRGLFIGALVTALAGALWPLTKVWSAPGEAVGSSPAAPARIVHSGTATVPAGQYLGHVMTGAATHPKGAELFPITTTLKPARLMGEATWPNAQWLTHPLFVVGSDERSLAWLSEHRDALAAMGALGWVVQARDQAEMKALAEAAQGLPLTPLASPWLAQELARVGAGVIPVLIGTDGAIRQTLPDGYSAQGETRPTPQGATR